MYKVVEREKVGNVWRDTVLYSGDSEKEAQRVAHFELQQYHLRKDERKGSQLTIILKVLS